MEELICNKLLPKKEVTGPIDNLVKMEVVAKEELPSTVKAAFGVFVPIPKYPFVLSQNNDVVPVIDEVLSQNEI